MWAILRGREGMPPQGKKTYQQVAQLDILYTQEFPSLH